jgi:iron(III) transport system substrate-binding protein
MKKFVFSFVFIGAIALGAVFVLQGCEGCGMRNEVNIYSHRHYASDDKLFEEFTKETGIKVNVVKATADQLIERLKQEGENTPCDLLITIDAGRLYRAKEMGLLQPIESAVLDSNLDPNMRDKDHYWYGFTYRARILAYNKDKVNPAELSNYDSLMNPKWKGKILVQSSEALYNQSLLASIVAHKGFDQAAAWAQAVCYSGPRFRR